VRLLGLDEELPGSQPVWRLSLLDLDHAGSWSWNGASEAVMRQIVAFLSEMERLTWTRIRAQIHGGGHRRNKPIPLDQLCAEARRRLVDLQLDDLDELFEFRLGSRRRLWGVARENGVFYPVWWDPEHQVYPVDPP
jgi:hypothetical protein